jgi:hypothetical protein
LLTRLEMSCPHCRKPVEEASLGSAVTVGPQNIRERVADDDWPASDLYYGSPLVSIARFANAAEAGFFADEIQSRLNVPAELTFDENFDAVNGYWSTWFVLSVPDSATEAAKAALRELLLATDADDIAQHREGRRRHSVAWGMGVAAIDDTQLLYGDMPAATGGFKPARRPSEPADDAGIHWGPIVLALTAGSVAFWVARKIYEHPPAGPRPIPAGQQNDHIWKKPHIWKELGHRPHPELGLDLPPEFQEFPKG